MDTPGRDAFRFTPTVNHRLRNCAFINNFSDPPPPPPLFGDTLECSESLIEDLGGETQVSVDEEHAQLLNLDGETQVMDNLDDDGCETCVVYVDRETQVMDDYVEDTQVYDAVYDQETQPMVLGGETEVQDDQECVRNVFSQLLRNGIDCDFTGTKSGIANGVCGDIPTTLVDKKKPGHSQSEPLEQGCEDFSATPPSTVVVEPGSFQRSFTSIRAASLRASGLAARCKALADTRNNSCNILVEKENEISSAEDTPGSKHYQGVAEHEVNNDANMCKTVPSVARKLFADDILVENGKRSNGIDGEEEAKTPLIYLPDNDDELPGLSYVDSQVPGDSTQADALDFIERFVKDNASDMQLDLCNDPLRRPISKPTTGAESFSNFSKKTTAFRPLVDQPISFEWDEELEDEGGGDFFCRMKEKILTVSGHKQRSLPQPHKFRRRGKLLVDKTDSVKFRGNSTAIQSDSKILFKNKKVSVLDTREADITRTLEMEFNGKLLAKSTEPTEAAACRTGIHDIFGIGPDTQIAAEAMEALFCGDPISGSDANDTLGNLALVSTVAASKSMLTAKIPLEKNSFSDELAIRKSKRIASENKTVHKYGTTSAINVENEVTGAHFVENINQANEEVLPSMVACRETRSMVLNQSSVILNQAHMALSKDRNSGTEFLVGVVVPKGKRSRKNVRDQSAFNDKSDGTHSCREVKRAGCTVHEVSMSDAKTSGSKAYSRRQHISRHLNTQGVKYRDYDKMKTTKDGCKGLSRVTCIEESAADNSVASSPMASHSLNAVNIDRDAGQNDVSNNHSGKASTVQVADRHMPFEMIKSISRTKLAKASHTTPDNNAVTGDARVRNSCKRQLPVNLSRSTLRKEISDLLSYSPKSLSELKRKRREMSELRILFSNHMDADVVKHQKKILARLGASLAFSISDATHFVADSFVRTRNMLEAIASGKPIVTHLWLESCYQTSCLIDEKAYILRDAKKERELGFSMRDTLVHASQQPLLQNQKVIITPSSKPSKDIVATLVKAVHGRVIENSDGCSLKVDKYRDNVLVLSCVEDYLFCQPFLNEGVKVYSSEILLSGIVTQRLDYARHRLFEDHVPRAVSRRSIRG